MKSCNFCLMNKTVSSLKIDKKGRCQFCLIHQKMENEYPLNRNTKQELEKIVLCDLQIKIYPELEEKFLTILKNSGLPNLKFGKQIDFVLEKWNDDESKNLSKLIEHNSSIVLDYIKHGIDNTMNKFN